MFPRLNAQIPEYLVAQLKGFRKHARGETDARSYMWAIASQLDDATIQSLADYSDCVKKNRYLVVLINADFWRSR
ncbi:hypothetical protein R69749_07802 [Paraburkholderia domus]|nr:hypothetical protein R69749_07802 [Paraburkholderia domus]